MNKLRVVGTSYTDHMLLANGIRLQRSGGIHNFKRAYGPSCELHGIDDCSCDFKEFDGKLNKVGQTPLRLFDEDDKLLDTDSHFCYGDSYNVYRMAKVEVPLFSSKTFISVDLLNPFQYADVGILQFWGQYADYIFLATQERVTSVPRIASDSKALWVFHNPKFVTLMFPSRYKGIIALENPCYIPMLDTIGAGDYFAGCTLRRIFEETGELDIENTFVEVFNMLKVQNDLQFSGAT
jgi:hypothetical protein